MKRILLLVMALLFVNITPAFAQEYMQVNAVADYDNATIRVRVDTSASYVQKISVVLYKKTDAEITPSSYVRIALLTGSGEVLFTLTDSDPSGFYVVSASGGGYMAAQAKQVVYFETKNEIENVTLPAFNIANESNLEQLLTEKRVLLGITIDEDYLQNKAQIHQMFLNIRKVDYNNAFASVKQVQDALRAVDALRLLQSTADTEVLQRCCEENKDLCKINTDEADYKGNETGIYRIFSNIIKIDIPQSMRDVETALYQSMGLNIVNRKNAKDMTAVIIKYAGWLGVSAEDYNAVCNKYGEVEFNKAFVERDFQHPSELLAAYKSRYEMLSKTEEPPKNDRTGGGGGGKITNVQADNAVTQEASPAKIVFLDIDEKHWAYEPVSMLSNAGILQGFEDGSFKPDDNVSREQFVKMLVLAFGLYDQNAESEFEDVPKEHWAASYIASAQKSKLVTGYRNQFAMGQNITRQDAAVMVSRLLKNLNVTLEEVNTAITYADENQFADYAKDSIVSLQTAGIISGMSETEFIPHAPLTRAQAAKLIYQVRRLL